MAFFRLRTGSASVWPAICGGALAQVWAAYRELDRTQWLRPAEIEQGQLAQVRALLAHSIAHVPYYRKALRESGISSESIRSMEDFRRIPVLTRRVYQEKQDSFVAEQLPPGIVATASPQTSGSSGTPTSVFQTNIVHLWWGAFYLRDLEWCGIDPRGTLAAIRSTGKRGDLLTPFLRGVTARGWVNALEPLIEMGPGHLMDISQDHPIQLEWLRRIAPTCLISYPANLQVLAEMLKKDGPLPGLCAIQSLSDSLSDEAAAAISAGFGVPVKNTYSCAETGYLASPCPAGHGLHVHAESVIFEVVDEAGRPCKAGQTGRVLLTSLNNFRGPFIRYEVGDEVTLGEADCPCGRGLPLLSSVQGKRSLMFRLPDGRLKNSARLTYLVRKVGGHWQHQVAQKSSDHVIVRVVPNTEWTEGHVEVMRAEVRSFFGSDIRVDVEKHQRLATPTSGKFQNMVLEFT